MTKYFFILGRNTKLSRLEILSYLEARNKNLEEEFFVDNLLVLNLEKDFSFNSNDFGGVLKTGKIIFEGNKKEFSNYLNGDEIVPSDKFTFSVSGDLDLAEFLKEKFKKEKKKGMLKHGNKNLKFQDGERIQIVNTDFDFFLKEYKGKIYFGLANSVYDSSFSENIDMNKPIRREALAISPRLSRILVNLSGAKKGDLLLDPFCGVGAVLIESLLLGINVYGVDKDFSAVESAKKNLLWLKNEFNFDAKYSLKRADSRRLESKNFDAIATETPLGVLLKKKVNDFEAKKIISNFEGLIIPILRSIREVKKEKAKIAITFPVVGKNHVDIEKVCNESGLDLLYGPILESRRDQFISRDILVLK